MSDTHTKALRPDAVLVARMAAAYRDGRDTASGGERRVNPWSGTDADPRTRVLAQMWGRGYSAGNPMPALDDPDAGDEPPEAEQPDEEIPRRAA